MFLKEMTRPREKIVRMGAPCRSGGSGHLEPVLSEVDECSLTARRQWAPRTGSIWGRGELCWPP
jgi:hypothetical protein